MYLYDNQHNLINSECSLDLFEGSQCITVESSGGADPHRNIKRRNPEYNKLLKLVLSRLPTFGIQITQIILDSSKVRNIPIKERVVMLDQSYPVNLSKVNIEEFRKKLQRIISSMHQDPRAKKGGSSQKRIRICLSKVITAEQLNSVTYKDLPMEKIHEEFARFKETDKEYLIKARLGQGQFRQSLISKYGGTCPITGISNEELLIASHIKPWKVCSNHERLDSQNGILLSALIDKLFDKGFITFSDAGNLIVSSALSREDAHKCGLDNTHKINLVEQSRHYMEYHRTIEFKGV